MQGLAEQVLSTPLRWVIMLAPLGFVMAMSFGLNRMSTATLQMLYWAFTVVMGLSMSSIFLVYTGTMIGLLVTIVLMARGIPEGEARKLVVRGFFAELINKIPVESLRERLGDAIEGEAAARGPGRRGGR